MENISLLLLILSLLQNFIITLFVYMFLSLNTRNINFFIVVFLTTLVQLFLRIFPVTPLIITFGGILTYVVYMGYIYKISRFIVGVTSAFSFLVFMIVESNITIHIMEYLFKISIYNIMSSMYLRFIFIIIESIIMILIMYILKYFNFNIRNYLIFLKNEDLKDLAGEEADFFRENKITYTFNLVIIFLIIQGLFINIYVWGEDLVAYFDVQSFLNSHVFINLIIIMLNIIMFLLIRHLIITLRMERNDIIKRIKEKNALRLDWEKRAQMHDRNHHLSMLYILLQVNKVDRAKEYLKGMVGEIQNVDAIVKSGNHSLNALIRSKIALGKKSGVIVEVKVNNRLKEMNIMDWDLNRIIGNLLDNAIEASEKKDGPRKIEIIIDNGNTTNKFLVITHGIVITDEIEEHIFHKGYTSKGEQGHGLGLAICKELVDAYRGNITIHKNKDQNFTCFEVLIPVS